jgi:putative tricarboxylic transport membrane protein
VLTIDRAAGAALVVIGLATVWESRQYPLGSLHRPGPSYMPVILALTLIAFGLVLAAMGARSGRLRDVRWPEWRHAVAIFAACAFAAWGLERLGYRVTVALVLLFLLGVLERQGLVVTALMTVVVAAGSFFLFDTLLGVPLPRGPFGI